MNIAIIGSGNIGGTLGIKWAAAGHQVVFGVRDPQSPRVHSALAGAGPNAQIASIEAAIQHAEVVLFAIPGVAMAETIAGLGNILNSKLVIDATNQFGQPVMNATAAIQVAAPHATIYRAFNSIGAENMAEPVIDGIQADMIYAGPDGDSEVVVAQLITATGLRPLRAGDLSQVGMVDSLAALWGALAYGQKLGRRIAFKVLGSA